MKTLARDRREMAQLLNARMRKTYASLKSGQELESESSLVKTYLVEAHLPEKCNDEEIWDFVTRNLNNKSFSKKATTRINKTDDSSLLQLECKTKIGGREENTVIFIDCSNTRFWVLHSMSNSRNLDWLLNRILSSTPSLDSAWIPSQLLEKASENGVFRGLSLDYDRRKMADIDLEDADAPVQFLKMQLWGNKAAAILNILRGESAFPNETTLSKVKVKFWLDPRNEEEFSVDDIKFNGKITARGTSFQSHVALLSDIYRRYADAIRHIESELAMKYIAEGKKLTIQGGPINMIFGRPIENVESFCESLFSCSDPFRLWGVPIRLSKDFWRVSGIDLHVGMRINFEIAPDFMRIYLPDGSCGNTVLRIYTNLQHYYDSRVEARNGDDNVIFKF